MSARSRRRRPSQGVTLIEATLTVPLFLFILIFIIDISRYFFTYAVLNFAAYQATDFLTKVPVGVDLTREACQGTGGGDCSRYRQAILTATDEALDIADLVASRPDTPSASALQAFDMFWQEDGRYQNASSTMTISENPVAVLRPGEAVKLSGENEYRNHPTRPYPANSPHPDWPQKGERWDTILSEHPFVVLLEARFQPLTPLIPELSIRASQLGYPFSRSTGVGGQKIPPTTTPPPLPSPSPTPSPDPTGTATPAPYCGCCGFSPENNCSRLSNPDSPCSAEWCEANRASCCTPEEPPPTPTPGGEPFCGCCGFAPTANCSFLSSPEAPCSRDWCEANRNQCCTPATPRPTATATFTPEITPSATPTFSPTPLASPTSSTPTPTPYPCADGCIPTTSGFCLLGKDFCDSVGCPGCKVQDAG